MKFTAATLALLPAATLAAEGFFSYDPTNALGPASWASVQVDGNQCGGSFQSGIDVPVSNCAKFGDYVLKPGTCSMDDFKFKLFPHAIQADYVGDCEKPVMQIPGKTNKYEAVQFHIHTGTDHALDGIYFGADLHIVHKEIGGPGFAVLGFFIEPTSPSDIPMFDMLLDGWDKVAKDTNAQCAANGTPVLPAGAGRKLAEETERDLDFTFNVYDLLQDGSTMYQYDGSLTTPPCSEVVFWNVVDIPVSISPKEFVRLTNLILDYIDPATCQKATNAAPSGFTGRPVQPINGRSVERVCPTSMEGSMPTAPGAMNGSTSGASSFAFGAVSAVVAAALSLLL